ncbi:hypothetical protein [Clostridium ljungdahlii]|uniref:Uncharacterized protein n=1 Tax=Clostridium ljungdahlii TaxID=1538 RepID=A0A168Q3D0_9CLOT|nr:hypothetical protein [Clostridium ljungdahlii]OAA88591.1 hypothetical protein WY13_01786 [Clostridium ljungdahlii]
MRKKFCVIFLALICLIVVGFKLFVQKNSLYSKNTTEMENKSMDSKKRLKQLMRS